MSRRILDKEGPLGFPDAIWRVAHQCPPERKFRLHIGLPVREKPIGPGCRREADWRGCLREADWPGWLSKPEWRGCVEGQTARMCSFSRFLSRRSKCCSR